MASGSFGSAGWGGTIHKDFKERFGAAYDLEVQRWVDAVRSGAGIDGPHSA